MDRIHQRVGRNTRINSGIVRNDPDRPDRPTLDVMNPRARELVGSSTPTAFTEVRNLRTILIGGGMSEKSIRLARKKAARGALADQSVKNEEAVLAPRKDATVPKVEKRLRDRRYVEADMDINNNGVELPYINYEPAGLLEWLHAEIGQAHISDEVELSSIVSSRTEARMRAVVISN